MGRPDFVLDSGDEKTTWVWVDGDVRIRFHDSSIGPYCESQARQIGLDLTVWPVRLAKRTQKQPGILSTLAEQERRDWADPTEPIVTRVLPQSLSWADPGMPTVVRTVQLRMTPSEVRSAVPGIDLLNLTSGEISGLRRYEDGSEVQISFWRAQAYRIYLSRTNLTDQDFAELYTRLARSFGTSYPLEEQAYEWKDKVVEFSILFMANEGSHQGSINSSLVDREVDREEQEAECLKHPPRYKASPKIRSFW